MRFEVAKLNDEKAVYLKIRNDDGEVDVFVADFDGFAVHEGLIMTFKKDGSFTLYKDRNKNIGLKLDGNGAIVCT